MHPAPNLRARHRTAKPEATGADRVPETRFGIWFQSTGIWNRYVLEPALEELALLLDAGASPARVLDLGCGEGPALPWLRARFDPDQLVGVDADPEMIERAEAPASAAGARLVCGDAARLELPDDSFQLVLCHQTLHHASEPEATAREILRVLEPGGVLLLSESCRRFVDQLWVRLFFRHPTESQRSPEGYVALLRAAGFVVDPDRIRFPKPRWARPIGRPVDEEPNQVQLAARKPVGGGSGSLARGGDAG